MREESQHSLYKLSSEVLLVTKQPTTIIPKAINPPLPLLICKEGTQKK